MLRGCYEKNSFLHSLNEPGELNALRYNDCIMDIVWYIILLL